MSSSAVPNPNSDGHSGAAGLLRRLRLLSGQPGVRRRRGAGRRLRGGRAREAPGRPPPAGPLPPVGLQGLQAQVQLCGPPTGRHHARAPAAEEGQPRVRGAPALHLGQPQPAAAQGGDPAQRHPLHREPPGSAPRAGGKLLRPSRRERLGAREPAVQLLRRHGRRQQSTVATSECKLQRRLFVCEERVLRR